jgi:selenocysteine-specific elongation factor
VDVLFRLESLQKGTSGDILYQVLLSAGIVPFREVGGRSGLSQAQIREGVEQLQGSGLLEQIEEGNLGVGSDLLVSAVPVFNKVTNQVISDLTDYHKLYPLRRGMPKEELKSRLKISTRVFNGLMKRWVRENLILDSGTHVQRSNHQVIFTPVQRDSANQLLQRFERNPFEPPSVKECQSDVGDELFQALIDMDELIQVSGEVVFRKEDYLRMIELVYDHFRTHDTLSVAEFRDKLKSSRRYVLGFLEHLDAIGVTLRDGDFRRLRKSKTSL